MNAMLYMTEVPVGWQAPVVFSRIKSWGPVQKIYEVTPRWSDVNLSTLYLLHSLSYSNATTAPSFMLCTQSHLPLSHHPTPPNLARKNQTRPDPTRPHHTQLWRSGVPSWKGRGPRAVDSTPPGAVPKYPDPGQQGNDLSRSRGYWIRSGAGLFPSGLPSPPTTCLNFSLWRDLSVWRIWGGYFGHRRSGLGGVYWEWGRRPRRRLIKPTVLWTTIPPWALPWSSPPVGGRLGCGSISGAVPSTDRADQEVTSARRRTNVVVLRTATISGGATGDSGRCHARTG